jgi:hypothetical protein
MESCLASSTLKPQVEITLSSVSFIIRLVPDPFAQQAKIFAIEFVSLN